MADNTDKMNFGIEDTKEISADDMFSSMESISGDPDKVKDIKLPDTKKKDEKKPDEKKEEEKEEDKSTLLDILSGDDGEEDGEQEDKKEPEDKKDVDNKEIEEEEETEDNYFNTISQELFKQGVFTLEEGEDIPEVNTGQELFDLFVNEKKKGAVDMLEGILSRHGQDKRDLFDAIILKGVSPKDYLQKYTQIEDLRAVDLTNTDMQERVMREELKGQGWDKEDIDAEVEKIKEYGDLESASKRYHKSLVKRTEVQLNEEKTRKEQEQIQDAEREEEYKNNITAIINAKLKEKEFDGIPLTADIANKTLDSIYTKKWRLPSGETITDFDNFILRLKRPENHALKVKMGLLVEMLKADPTLSLIQKKAVSKENNELFSSLEKKKIKKQDVRKPEAKTTSWFS